MNYWRWCLVTVATGLLQWGAIKIAVCHLDTPRWLGSVPTWVYVFCCIYVGTYLTVGLA